MSSVSYKYVHPASGCHPVPIFLLQPGIGILPFHFKIEETNSWESLNVYFGSLIIHTAAAQSASRLRQLCCLYALIILLIA